MSELRLGQDMKYLQRKANYDGLIVFIPRPNELFMDIDTPNGELEGKVFKYIFGEDHSKDECGNDGLGIKVISQLVTVSNGGNTHYYLRLNRDLSDLERAIFQVCLGSDKVKELFSFIQMKLINGIMENEVCECPIALFETKEQASRVILWRDDATS